MTLKNLGVSFLFLSDFIINSRLLFNFQSMPRLFDLIESYLRGESVRKAAVFTPEELMQFWKEASSKNTFWLVRKIASSLAFLGGNRLAELRRAKQSAISRCAEGYLFTFVPAKQRGHVRESSF